MHNESSRAAMLVARSHWKHNVAIGAARALVELVHLLTLLRCSASLSYGLYVHRSNAGKRDKSCKRSRFACASVSECVCQARYVLRTDMST